MSSSFVVKMMDGTTIEPCDPIKNFCADAETGMTYLYNAVGGIVGALNTDQVLSMVLTKGEQK